ncbi:MAG TPA: hypothetical protein VLF61_00360 [Rhabdochlamydiaceae bacterium]|nr:hypothetical protein [Rhabdochlamydiaceae bacterium]
MLKQLKNKILKSFVFWGSLGPALLLCTFVLLMMHAALGILTPYYWIAFVSSFLIGLFVTLVSMLEIDALFLEKKEQMQAYKEEMAHLQSALRQAQVNKLEEKETLQNEIQRLEQTHDEEQKTLSTAYEKLFSENTESKNRAHALQASLEAALEELGKVRQLEYLKQELDKKIQELQTPKEIETDTEATFEHIQKMDEELVSLEQEVVVLHEIISKVLTEKKVTRPRKPKKSDELNLLEDILKTQL